MQRAQNNQNNIEKKEKKVERLLLPDFKTNYKAVIKYGTCIRINI